MTRPDRRGGGSVVWSHRRVVTRHLDPRAESPRDSRERSVVDRTRSTRRRRRRTSTTRAVGEGAVRARGSAGGGVARSSIGSIDERGKRGKRARRWRRRRRRATEDSIRSFGGGRSTRGKEEGRRGGK